MLKKLLLFVFLLLVVTILYWYWPISSVNSSSAMESNPAAEGSASADSTESSGTHANTVTVNRIPNSATTSASVPKRDAQSRATPVRAATVTQQDIQESLTSLGTVVPSESVLVRPQISGVITRILFTEGQMVKQGDVLFEIDTRQARAALQQAEGALLQNKAKLSNARQDLKRYQTLYKQDSIARQQVESQQALVREYEANQKSLQAAVDQSQLDLEYTRVSAPISGRAGLRSVNIGHLVTANSAEGLVTIIQTQPIDVEFSIPQSRITQVAEPFYRGLKLPVIIRNSENSLILDQGSVLTMDNQVDTTTGAVKLKARFSNQDYGLFPNQFVNVSLVVRQQQQALVVPSDAIQYAQNGAFVFLIKADLSVQTQPIKTGIVDQGYTQILEGLQLGDRFVQAGIDRLRNGSNVEIIE